MQRTKLLVLAFVSILILGMVAISTASAALPEVLNVNKEQAAVKFKGEGGQRKFSILKSAIGQLVCKKTDRRTRNGKSQTVRDAPHHAIGMLR